MIFKIFLPASRLIIAKYIPELRLIPSLFFPSQINVYDPGVIAYQKGLTMFKAIELAGGFKKNSLKRKSYVKRANGSIEKINSLFGSRTKKLFPGDSIFVPLNEDPQEFDLTIFLSQLTSTLANVAAIIVIADNANN